MFFIEIKLRIVINCLKKDMQAAFENILILFSEFLIFFREKSCKVMDKLFNFQEKRINLYRKEICARFLKNNGALDKNGNLINI